MTNFDKIKGLMREKGITYVKASEILNMSVTNISDKLNGKIKPFDTEQAKAISGMLGLSKDETMSIFFGNELH